MILFSTEKVFLQTHKVEAMCQNLCSTQYKGSSCFCFSEQPSVSTAKSKQLHIPQLQCSGHHSHVAKDNAVNIKLIFACKCNRNISNICLRNVSILKTFKDFESISIYQYYYMGIMVQVRKIAQNYSAFDRLSPLISQTRICKQEAEVAVKRLQLWIPMV